MRAQFKITLLFLSLFALCFETACRFNQSKVDPYFAPGFHFNEASLAIVSNSASNDFGTVTVFQTRDLTFTVTNSGVRSAENISGAFVTTSFDFKGGTYPGTGGTCSATINGSSSCTLVITFSPVLSLSFTSDFSLFYDDGLNGLQRKSLTLTGTGRPIDATSPTAGGFAASTSVAYTSFTLNWNAASDNQSSASVLEYLVCTATSAVTISTSSGCLNATIAMNWTAATTSLAISGKTQGTTYYYNVLVRDETGNTTIYEGISQSTLNAFVSSWKTDNAGTSTNVQITLPLEASGSYNFTVDWGDSSSSTITAWNDAAKTHTYSSIGTYTVTISGTLTGFRFNNGGDRRKILTISQWGPLRLGNSNGYFYGANNLTITATDVLNLTGTTNLSYAFASCTSLTTTTSINSWDVSSVTNMSSMFQSATVFNQNIGSWNVSAVTDMSYMFYNAPAFNSNIGSWNVSAVTEMSSMFYNATVFSRNIGSWNVSAVRGMSSMFRNAIAFNQNIGSWNVGGVTDMSSMFQGATAFNQNIGSWNVISVTTMFKMLTGANAFTQANYDSLLISWSGLALQSNVLFHTSAAYTGGGAADAARTSIISTYSWTITDGGPN